MSSENKASQEANQKKRKVLRALLIVLTGVFIAVFGVSLFMIIQYYSNAKKEQGTIDSLKKELVGTLAEGEEGGVNAVLPGGSQGGGEAISNDGSGSSGNASGSGQPFVSQYAAFHDVNPDYIGWLYMEGTQIDYPVMYTPNDPEYYSRRDFAKQDTRGGTPFVGPGATIDDDCFYIYGHNMSSGLFFGTLNYYMDEEFGLSHRTFTFETLTERRTYEIIGVLKTYLIFPGHGFVYYGYGGSLTEEEFDYFVSNIREQSMYDFGVVPKYGEQLLVLSTCSYHVDTGRFAVIARRIE